LRGLASLEVQAGEYQEAIQLLARDSTDLLTGIMLCSVLQESGNCVAADSVLSRLSQFAEMPDALYLLRIRQSRCEGNAACADSLALLSPENADSDVSSLIKLDHFLSGNPAKALSTEEILTAMKVDLCLTGSIYRGRILSVLASDDMEHTHPFRTARIHALAGDIDNAERILSTVPVREMELDELVFYIHILIQQDKLNDAASVIRRGMEAYPNSSDLLEQQGIMFLRGGNARKLTMPCARRWNLPALRNAWRLWVWRRNSQENSFWPLTDSLPFWKCLPTVSF